MYPGNGGGGGATGSMTSDGAGISNIREVFKFSILNMLNFLLKVLKCTQNHNFGCSFRFKFDNEIREICAFSKAIFKLEDRMSSFWC